MSIARQGVSFLIVGCCLIVLDGAVFVALIALGVMPVAANITERVTRVLISFRADNRITFSVSGSSRLGQYPFVLSRTVSSARRAQQSTGYGVGRPTQLANGVAGQISGRRGLAILSFIKIICSQTVS